MGQKTHPIGFRLGIVKYWDSSWFVSKDKFAQYLNQDLDVRRYIKKKLSFALISCIKFERKSGHLFIKIKAARPGVVIGRKGAGVDKLKADIQKMTGAQVRIDIDEVRNPDFNAQLLAEGISLQLEKRISFRRAMKRAISNAFSAGAKGFKVEVSGRLGGAEMARREGYKEGKIPLHTLRADIDYGFSEAFTTYGIIGVKVWLYKGEVLKKVSNLISKEKSSLTEKEGKNPKHKKKVGEKIHGDDAKKS